MINTRRFIIVDEDSEIILGSTETPFNINDDKELPNLVDGVENELGLIPQELSADKGYATTANRAYLKDKGIKCNMQFADESNKEAEYFKISDFQISEDLTSITCPNNETTDNCKRNYKRMVNLIFEKSILSFAMSKI